MSSGGSQQDLLPGGKMRGENLVGLGSRNSDTALTLMLLQNVMAQFMQEHFLQHESFERVVWPFHKGHSQARLGADDCANSLKPTNVRFPQNAWQAPRQ